MPRTLRRRNRSLAIIQLLTVCLVSLASQARSESAGNLSPLRIVGLAYPHSAAFSMLQGQVEVECTVSPSGIVSNAKVLRGNPVLGSAAAANAMKWVFDAGSLGQKDQPLKTVLLYRFRLVDDPQVSLNEPFTFELPNLVTVTALVRHFNP
jgi:TonB family protein